MADASTKQIDALSQMDATALVNIQSMYGSPTPDIETIMNKIVPETVFSNAAPILDALKFTHLVNASMKNSDMVSFFKEDRPTASVATERVQIKKAAEEIITIDGYRPPEATESASFTMPSILQMIFFLCKRIAVYHIESRIGCVPPANGEAVSPDCINNRFDEATRDACHLHITAIAQLIQDHVPFEMDDKKLNVHLDLCMNLITAYCRDAASSTLNKTSSTISVAGTSVARSTSLIAPSQTNIIFNLTSMVPIEQIIYNTLQPWLRMLYVSTFILDREPHRFSDVWSAQYIIFVVGYIIADKCASTITTGVFEPFDTTSTKILPFDAYKKLCTAIATQMTHLAEVQTTLQQIYNDAINTIQRNQQHATNLTDTGTNLEYRRKNLEAMVMHYETVQRKADATRKWFYVAIALFGAVVAAIAALIVFSKPALAIMGSGLILLGITIYAFTIVLVKNVRDKE